LDSTGTIGRDGRMLREVSISNFVLFDEAKVEFHPGFNVLTGETGVGKSLLIGALTLLIGGRASADAVGRGGREARVDGLFELQEGWLRDRAGDILGCEIEDGMLLVTRSVEKTGKSRCYVNGRPATVGMLRELGEMLVAVHGQRDHETLMRNANQRELLDNFGGLQPLRGRFSELYDSTMKLRERRDDLAAREKQRRDELELLRFQAAEIDAAKPSPGEMEKLETERGVLLNAEKIAEAVSSGYETLYESEGSVFERLSEVERKLEGVAEFDDALKVFCEVCDGCKCQVEEAARSLRDYVDKIEFDPARLEEVEERLVVLRNLAAKYGGSEEAVLEHRETAVRRMKELSTETKELEQAEEKLSAAAAELRKVGAELTRGRKAAAEKLARTVLKDLAELGMRNARFTASVSAREPGERWQETLEAAGPNGFDEIEFLISTNVGEEAKPLRKIASGGELSRIMLALKHDLAAEDRTPVLVFDEIDANVGGRVGRVVGEKMAAISARHQVICVTHLAQIASCADRQFRVWKEVRGGRTYCAVEPLSDESRIEELAEMIRGDRKTETTRKQALEMLHEARNKR